MAAAPDFARRRDAAAQRRLQRQCPQASGGGNVQTAAVPGILPGVEAQQLFAAALLEEQKAPDVAGFW